MPSDDSNERTPPTIIADKSQDRSTKSNSASTILMVNATSICLIFISFQVFDVENL